MRWLVNSVSVYNAFVKPVYCVSDHVAKLKNNSKDDLVDLACYSLTFCKTHAYFHLVVLQRHNQKFSPTTLNISVETS